MLWSCFINSLILQNALAVNFFFIGGEQNGSWTNKTMTCEFLAKQILQHSWLEWHLTIFWQKVHFLGQILDYKGQIMSKFELNGTKKPSTEIGTAPFYLYWYGITIRQPYFKEWLVKIMLLIKEWYIFGITLFQVLQ